MRLKFCKECRTRKPFTDFHYIPRYNCYQTYCRPCNSLISARTERARRVDDPRYKLWATSKSRAKIKGIEHTINQNDIETPTHCPYLGIELDYSVLAVNAKRTNSASIDRIDSTLGYVPGNIQVISILANRMKNNASREQLLTFARNVLEIHKHPPVVKVLEQADLFP